VVYIVDDDGDVRRSLRLMLQVSGFQARAFDGGAAFLGEAEALEPGIVLLDLRMRGVDGLEVLGELARRGIGWPVIVMTGHGEPEVAQDAIAAGAVAFVEKPFEEALLFRCLEEAGAAAR
jgi:two-component system response regulator FixJ